MPFGPGQPALQPSACREENRADEEGDGVSRVADQLRVAGERANEEAHRAKTETEGHPTSATHTRRSLSPVRGDIPEHWHRRVSCTQVAIEHLLLSPQVVGTLS